MSGKISEMCILQFDHLYHIKGITSYCTENYVSHCSWSSVSVQDKIDCIEDPGSQCLCQGRQKFEVDGTSKQLSKGHD